MAETATFEAAFDYDGLVGRLQSKMDEVEHTVAQANARAKAAEARLAAMQKELQEAAFRTYWDGTQKDRLATLRREQAAAILAVENGALVEAHSIRVKTKIGNALREVKYARQSGREPVIRLADWILGGD